MEFFLRFRFPWILDSGFPFFLLKKEIRGNDSEILYTYILIYIIWGVIFRHPSYREGEDQGKASSRFSYQHSTFIRAITRKYFGHVELTLF